MIPLRPAGAGLPVLLLLLLAARSLVPPVAGATPDPPPELTLEALARGYRPLEDLRALAMAHGVTFGIYGGTVRDRYLGQSFSVISDLDMVYDSSEPGFPAFRDAVLAYHRAHEREMPGPDFHYDLSAGHRDTRRQEHFHRVGITATKVAVLEDGRVLDPTSRGVPDLVHRVWRYDAPEPREPPELNDIGRFVRDHVRLPGFRADPASVIFIKRSLAAYRAGPTRNGGRAARLAHDLRDRAGPDGLIDFPLLVSPARRSIRALHHDLPGDLAPTFPLDLFVFELFKCVTQAPDMASMRASFELFDVPGFLAAVGLEPEARLLSDPTLTRRDLFERFRFPGTGSAASARRAFPVVLADARRRTAYHEAFADLAALFPPESSRARVLAHRARAFLSPSSYRLLRPGDDLAAEILAYLDTDFSIGALPGESIRAHLASGHPGPGDPASRPGRERVRLLAEALGDR